MGGIAVHNPRNSGKRPSKPKSLKSGGEDRFEVQLGRIRTTSGSRRAVSFMNGLERRMTKPSRGSKRSGSGRRAQAMSFNRRVLVKVSIKKMMGGGLAALRKHIDYIERDGAGEGEAKAKLYGRGAEQEDLGDEISMSEPDAPSFADRCEGDRHHFRFVIAPEDANAMQDLSVFTKDLVGQMERDLGTKLDWVGTNHYDTGQPHTHLIIRGVRDNGKDLVLSRKYISHQLRERAEALVELELGPVSQMEGRVRLARTVDAAGYTALDTSLAQDLSEGIFDKSKPVPDGRVWHRQLQVRRLNRLKQMGLAEPIGSGRWKLDTDFGDKLRQISERREIISAIHRTMKQSGAEIGQPMRAEFITERNMFDPNSARACEVTGIVRHFGRPDDTRPGGFVVIEALNGSSVFSRVREDETFETLKRGQVITLKPHPRGARLIDHSIAEYAAKHQGVYSEVHHATQSDRVSPAYAQAHVRRLEALRRKNVVARQSDGSWKIPSDYLERAANYEVERTRHMPAGLDRDSQLTLRQMERAEGVTWLDTTLANDGIETGRAPNFMIAFEKRLERLRSMGLETGNDGKLPSRTIESLKTMDLQSAAAHLEVDIGKPYSEIGSARQVDGIYRGSIDRPSGKFAVIERSREFTLVPWRPVMEKRLGQSISGRISGGGISWDVTGRKGPER